MIYDTFPFFDELDLLEIRLNELDGVVDKFVLAEADKTHTNQPKPFHFEQNKARFEKFLHKIIHIKVTDFPDGPDAWVRENHQRIALARGLSNCNDDDLVLVSDLDEIPRAARIAEYRSNPGVQIFQQSLFYYFFNCLCTNETWFGTRMLRYADLKRLPSFQAVRHAQGTPIFDGGWHFSYIGDVDKIIRKIEAFAHTEFNQPELKNRDRLIERMKQGLDPYNRGQKFRFIDLDPSFPKYLLDHRDRFAACIAPVPQQESTKPVKCSIITPWWDHGELLQLWERNVQVLPKDIEIIFIDNGSQPPTRDALAEFCRRTGVKLIRNEKNRGFSAANNQGAAAAQGEYLLFLNNDIEIHRDPIDFLIGKAQSGPAGPGPLVNELHEVYLEGWCLCIKRQTLSDIGGWSEEYTLGYWDDVDVCHRARKAGLQLTAVPEVTQMIRHLGNTTGRDGRVDQIALHIKNRGIFAKKFYSSDKPKIVIDGVFYQMYQTGIARVWTSLMQTWAADGFARHIVLLDRGNTAPKIPGVRTRAMNPYDYAKTAEDSNILQYICDEERADVFISTYYTTPLSTPSVFMAHDMIPEIFGWDLNHPMWKEKHAGIKHAAAFVCVSESTKRDLLKYCPFLDPSKIQVTPLAAGQQFKPQPRPAIDALRAATGIKRPYFLTVGARGGYKNTELSFKALGRYPRLSDFDIFCAGHTVLEPEYAQFIPNNPARSFHLTDDELATAYSDATALLHPSTYEGFGLPVLEALACGCPVITTKCGSLAEVAGDAAIFVEPNDVAGMLKALDDVQNPDIRQGMIERGLAHAARFNWQRTADGVRDVLLSAVKSVRP